METSEYLAELFARLFFVDAEDAPEEYQALLANLTTAVEAGTQTLEQAEARLVTEAKGATGAIAAAYQFLTGVVPSEAGFAFLLSAELAGDFGQFNFENRFINQFNALVQENSTAQATFNLYVAPDAPGDADLIASVTALYDAMTNTTGEARAEAIAYLTRPDALAFYRGVAEERILDGSNPGNLSLDQAAAIVALGSIANILVRDGVPGLGGDVSALLEMLADDMSPLDATLGTDISGIGAGEAAIELTTGTDSGPAFTGGDGDDTFQADVVQTSLLPNQTLNNTDDLNGGGGWNTLNAQLVDFYTVPAGLTNIQEINLSGAPGLPPLILPSATLDLVNANDVQVLGFSTLTSLFGGAVSVRNIQSEISEINFANTGGSFFVEHINDALSGDDDSLDINLSNAGVELNLDHWNGDVEDEGYEVININSTGPIGNELDLFGDAATPTTVNVSGTADLEIDTPNSNEGLSLNHLRTFNAAALAAGLYAEFAGAAVDADLNPLDVSITGAQGDNYLDFNGLTTGNLTIETFDGDDRIEINGNTGDVVVDVAEGNNIVDVFFIDGALSVTAGDGDDYVTVDLNLFNEDDQGENVALALGGGSNTLRVIAGTFTGGDVSFAEADITGVQTLVVGPPFTVGAGGGTVDLAGLGDLEAIVFQDDVELNGVAEMLNAPETLELTFEGELDISATGSLVIEDVTTLTVNAEDDVTIDGTIEFEDVEAITLNVGVADPFVVTDVQFSYGASGVFIGDDLEVFTINLINGADYVGPQTLTSSTLSLEEIIVTGDEESEFTMIFGDEQSPEIAIIDLTGLAGEATVDLFEAGPGFAPLTINIGSGDLDYGTNIGSSSDRETFVFTQDFEIVTIDGFSDGSTDTDDRLDLSALGVTSAADLNIEDDGFDTTITSELFDGTIVLLGATFEGDADFATFNIIYA